MTRQNNKRHTLKRKLRKKQLQEIRLIEQLYNEAKLDPQTVEGQSHCNINIISTNKQITTNSYYNTIKNIFGF